MAEFLYLIAAGLLLTVAASLLRMAKGPSAADRVMGAQLVGTGGIAVLLLLAFAMENHTIVDVAIVLALLAAFAAVGFVKAASPDGAGDPEEEAR